MASDRPSQTAVDYVTIVLSPVLIMGLVGSLVFFLLEILYKTDGPWKERLQWILFFFVFGAVLVARISMMGEIASRATLYGVALAGVTYLAVQAFVEYPQGIREISFLINLILIGVVWWCAHRLTKDCTNVDEDVDMSGEGLMTASGLEDKQQPKPDEDDGPVLLEEEKKRGQQGWWERYQKYREEKNKKRTLGVWVVYFSLAALPVFGLGQSLIPLTSPDRRKFAFWLMTIYVACGLGLLLTTCFLGLRRYLRQKRVQMPAAMTGAWLVMGATLLVGLLLVGAILPRPYSEYPLVDLDPAGSAKRKASQMAVKGDSPTEGEGRPGEGKDDGKKEGGKSGQKGADKDGKGKGKDGGSNKDKDGKGQGKDGKQDGDSGKQQGGKQGNQKDQSKSGSKQGEREGSKKGEDQKTDQKREDEKSKNQEDRPGSSPPPASSNPLQQILQRIGPILKWVVFAILILVVLVAVLRGGLGFLANFSDWAKKMLAAWRNFWANLFGRKSDEASGSDEESAEAEAERHAPFSAFANPFESGKAGRLSPRELVRYTFRAVEAWAREHDLARHPGETATEFLRRLGDEVPALEQEAQRLEHLHARAEYARGALPDSTPDQLAVFWEKLDRVAAAPMSA